MRTRPLQAGFSSRTRSARTRLLDVASTGESRGCRAIARSYPAPRSPLIARDDVASS